MEASLLFAGVLVAGFVLGSLARLIVPGSQRLTWSETTLIGIAGAGLGALLVNIATPDTPTTGLRWGTVLGGLGGSVMVLLVVMWLMNHFGIRQSVAERLSAQELIAAGETHQVEFKQTARWNIHSRQKDPKIELVVAKTVAGFLNGDGGTLLIGVADDGSTPGLDDDLKLMKKPDLDRYELWLTDYLERCFGKPPIANITVSFELVGNTEVCRIDVEAGPAPVFLDEPGGNREADMYVRMGNSTRKLLTDEALEYVSQRW
ncbi:MAG: ATP-binding protein [bacterium]|nr:ATP-binding protein [bacterium]MCP4966079.1 ATP-binding protein [bacterium]